MKTQEQIQQRINILIENRDKMESLPWRGEEANLIENIYIDKLNHKISALEWVLKE